MSLNLNSHSIGVAQQDATWRPNLICPRAIELRCIQPFCCFVRLRPDAFVAHMNGQVTRSCRVVPRRLCFMNFVPQLQYCHLVGMYELDTPRAVPYNSLFVFTDFRVRVRMPVLSNPAVFTKIWPHHENFHGRFHQKAVSPAFLMFVVWFFLVFSNYLPWRCAADLSDRGTWNRWLGEVGRPESRAPSRIFGSGRDPVIARCYQPLLTASLGTATLQISAIPRSHRGSIANNTVR